MGDRGQAQPQCQNHRRRSAFYPHRIATPTSSVRFVPVPISPSWAALINYAIENNRVAHEYLVNYTNAAFIIKDGFKLPEDGLCSRASMQAPRLTTRRRGTTKRAATRLARSQPSLSLRLRQRKMRRSPTRRRAILRRDSRAATPTILPRARVIRPRDQRVPKPWAADRSGSIAHFLRFVSQHPRCVYQLLKQQYSRYTPEMVERITGIPQGQFLKAADMFTSIRKDGDMKKVAHGHLRCGLDAAQLRHADHPHRGDAAIADGQCRTRRRRRERIARTLQHSGRNRHGRHLRHSSRLSEDAQACRQRPEDLPRPHHPEAIQARTTGSRSTTGRTLPSSRCRS